MIIYGFDREQRPRNVRYYKYTNQGRPIFTCKKEASDMYGADLETAQRHLQIMRPAWEIGVIQRGDRFKRKKPESVAA